jgi:hypothetical protein
VENFFGLQGQEREKQKKREKKSPELVGALMLLINYMSK